MAEEPKKQIDQILRDYAAARKEGFELPLHPATRKMLHAEVARRYNTSRGKAFWNQIRAFWPQIAFGTGLGAILLVAVLSLRHPSRKSGPLPVPVAAPVQNAPESELGLQQQPQGSKPLEESLERQSPALNKQQRDQPGVVETEALDKSLPAASPATQPSPPAQPRFDFSKDAGDLGRNTRSLSSAKRVELSVAEPVPALEQQAKPEVLRATAQSSAPAIAAAGRSSAVKEKTNAVLAGKLEELSNLGAAMRFQFVELPDRSRAAGRPQVLTSFQVEQSGQDLNLIEKDGSVYTGHLTPAPDPTQPQAANRRFGFVTTPLGPIPSNAAVYDFQAQGTNLSLRTPVIVEGQLIEKTNASPSPEKTFSFSTNAPPRAAQPITPLMRARRAIVGRATVGQTNQFPVNAVSVETP